MDVLAGGDDCSSVDAVAVGNGGGIVSVVGVRWTVEGWHCEWHQSWVAEKERQLLGVYFRESLGCRLVRVLLGIYCEQLVTTTIQESSISFINQARQERFLPGCRIQEASASVSVF
jgi:hypothetical protein